MNKLLLAAGLLSLCFLSCTKDRKFPVAVTNKPQDTTGQYGNLYYGIVKVNEIMATESKAPSINEFGTVADWVEFYNPGDSTIHMKEGEWFVTDTLGAPDKFPLPAIDLASHGFLVVWCDGLGSISTNPDVNQKIHTNFKLSSGGEQMGISYKGKGAAKIVDGYTFKAQQKDISLGRYKDGINNWQTMQPTRGTANIN